MRKRRRSFRRVAFAIAATVLLAGVGTAYAGSTWPVYHGNAQRTGNDTSEPNLLPLHGAWNASLDGAVYGQPVVAAGRVFAATERNTVYALDAHDGHILWARHLGAPMTNVNAQVGCGNIDPLGVTSTAVIDTTTGTIFVVATIQDSFRHIHHQLVGLDIVSGNLRVSTNADPGGVQNPLYIQQRAGLALGNGRVYIGYGGYSGDCGPYHGWLVSLDETGHGKVVFDPTPHTGLGAIWATGGAAIDGSGRVFATTGNPDSDIAHGDYGESILRFDATLHVTGVRPTFPGGDNDIGSVAPALLPNNMLFQIGKQQTGYLIDTNSMGVLKTLHVCNGEAFGATAFDGARLYVPCDRHIQTVNVDVAHRTMSLGWTGFDTSDNAEPPILASGTLWFIDRGAQRLYGLLPSNGAVRTSVQLGGLPHFASPSAALGLVLIGTNSGVTALAGPSGVPPHAPNACRTQTSHTGYWIATRDGNVFAFGGAPACGSLVGAHLAQPVVGMAGLSTPGYWLVARDGGIFSFGTARFHGSTGAIHLAQPIVGMAATPSGNGYWLVARDGGIFAFGDAHFYGSTGDIRLAQPIVGMATTPSGHGYWLVARDGGIFAFGDAHFYGSMGGHHLNLPVVGMASSPSGRGYWLVASDGGIFAFGDAPFRGSTGAIRLASPIVAMTRSGSGYWFVAGDGGVFAFGAPFRGSAAGLTAGAPALALAHD